MGSRLAPKGFWGGRVSPGVAILLGVRCARSLSGIAVAVALGCGPGIGARSHAPKDETARLQEKLSFVQAAACLSAAEEKECDPALAATFRSAGTTRSAEPPNGSLWCEGGRPHVRVAGGPEAVDGAFGQVVWEAIWRVLKATGSCASAYGAPLSVTRNGKPQACEDPRFDMHALLDMAVFLAKKGPPARPPKPVKDTCAIDPTRCIDTRTMCPLFLGDPWNGVTSGAAAEGGDGGAAAGDTPAPEDLAERPQRPSQGEVTRALNTVLDKARRCLRPGGDPARVAIVFQSDGSVQRVDVKSAGGASPGCIQRTLGNARVYRFLEPTFEVGLTFRAHD